MSETPWKLNFDILLKVRNKKANYFRSTYTESKCICDLLWRSARYTCGYRLSCNHAWMKKIIAIHVCRYIVDEKKKIDIAQAYFQSSLDCTFLYLKSVIFVIFRWKVAVVFYILLPLAFFAIVLFEKTWTSQSLLLIHMCDDNKQYKKKDWRLMFER